MPVVVVISCCLLVFERAHVISCCLLVFERAHNIAQPTQEMGAKYVGGLSMSADVGKPRESSDICRVKRNVAEMSATLPT